MLCIEPTYYLGIDIDVDWAMRSRQAFRQSPAHGHLRRPEAKSCCGFQTVPRHAASASITRACSSAVRWLEHGRETTVPDRPCGDAGEVARRIAYGRLARTKLPRTRARRCQHHPYDAPNPWRRRTARATHGIKPAAAFGPGATRHRDKIVASGQAHYRTAPRLHAWRPAWCRAGRVGRAQARR